MDTHTANILLETLQDTHEGINYLENCIQQGEISLSDLAILDSLVDLLPVLEKSTASVALPNRVREINANILFYIEQLKQNAYQDNTELFVYDFRFHFCSLVRILEFEIAYIVENFINKEEYPRFYPEVGNVDHSQIVAQGKNARCLVSVVLLAYNNLDYTRDCVDSILMNTDDVEFELILVNNGSTDGTKEYFDSIPGAKVIHLEYNIHLVKGFNLGLMAAEGKYSAAVCNDFIFTPNWLNNLLVCIESDPEIGFVSPGATSISNMQQIAIPFISKADFREKAREYNISDPSKWEERVVLLPNVLCCPTALLNRIGYYDTRFFRGEFLDDDISFRIRRAGFKLVYCGDTVTHHYGSITTASDHQTNSLEEGRKTFFEKYGLDAWFDARMSPVYMEIDYSRLSEVDSILGIDVKCGATLLQIKNNIWLNHGTKPQLSVFTTERKYLTDAESISEDASLLSTFENLPSEFDKKADLVFIEKPLDCYNEDLDTLFNSLSKVMTDNGKLIFMVNNSINIETLYEMLNASNALHNRKIYIREMLYLQAANYGFTPSSVIDFGTERNFNNQQTLNQLASFLAGGREHETNYLQSKMHFKFGIYQMDYQAVNS